MAIYRGNGGSLDGLVESEVILLAISQGGTGSSTASGARTNLGLGTAATTDASAYATAAQGALADSATQPGDLATVATTGSYSDLTGKPTLGTASAEDVGYFATAAQGTLADSAVQPGDLATVATTGSYNDLTDKPTIPTNLDSLTDVVITSATNGQGLQFNGTNWVNSSAGSGTVTSVAMSVPTGLVVSGSPVTTTGTLAVSYDTGYAIPTTAKQTEWDTAYTDRLKWDGGSTGLNAATGRTSLGLGTAATTASTDYATAAQGTKADNALTAANPSFTGTLTGTGDIRLNNGSADGAQLQLASSGYSDWNIDNYSGRLRAYYGSTEYFTIDASGNVGLGISAPSQELHIKKDQNAATEILIDNPNTGTSGRAQLELSPETGSAYFTANSSTSTVSALAGGALGAALYTSSLLTNGLSVGTTDGPLKFFAGSTSAERGRFDPTSGYFGIGITAPTCALDVVGGIKTSRTAVTSPATTDGNVFSGTYTPTLTNTTNVAVSSAGVAQYMRVGNVVTVSGQVDIDPTATGDTVMGVSLPIASNIASQTNVGGTFISLSGATFQGGSIYGDGTNDRAVFRLVASSTSNFAYQYTFTYRVI